MNLRYDLTIVGGGVVGVMMALLAKRRVPELSVGILDRGLIGGGATQYSAFLDMPYGITSGVRSLSRRSQELFDELAADIPNIPCHRFPMRVVASADRRDEIQGCLTQAMKTEIDIEAPDKAPAGLVLPDSQQILGVVDAARWDEPPLVPAIVAELQRRGGVDFIEGSSVRSYDSEGGIHRWRLGDGRAVEARYSALCTGPWLPSMLRTLFGVEVESRLKRVAALLLPHPPDRHAVITYLFDDDAFFMPQPDRRRWLFSFRAQQWDVEPDVMEGLGHDDFARASQLLARLFPNGYPRPLGCRVFCDAYSATRDPFIDVVAPGVVAAGVAGGSGVRLAPAMAENALERLELFSNR